MLINCLYLITKNYNLSKTESYKMANSKINDNKVYYAVDANGEAYIYKNCPKWNSGERTWLDGERYLKIGCNHKFTDEPIEVMIVSKKDFDKYNQKKSEKIQNDNKIVLYIYANEYVIDDMSFIDYSLFDNKDDILKSVNDDNKYGYVNAIYICNMPYPNGVYCLTENDPSFILNEDFDISDLEDTVYSLESGKKINSIYVFEQYDGDGADIVNLIMSTNLSLMLKTLVDKIIDWREYSEEDIISKDNGWLQMNLKVKTVNKHNENTIIYLKMFDGKTLNARILNDDIAKELEEICKSKNIELIIN